MFKELYNKIKEWIMSLYLGKDTYGNNILHIATGTVSQSSMSNGAKLSNTIYHTGLNITEVITTYTLSTPTTVNTSISFPSDLTNYISSSSFSVFFFVRDNSTYKYVESGLTGYAVTAYGMSLSNINSAGWASYSSLFSYTRFLSSDCKVIVCKNSSPLTGSILIDSGGVKIGGVNLAAKSYLILNSSSGGFSSYYNGNITSTSKTTGTKILLDNKSLIVDGTTKIISDSVLSRVHASYHGNVSWVGSAGSISCVFSGVDTNIAGSVTVRIPISVGWVDYGSGRSQSTSGTLLHTFQLSINSVSEIGGGFPYAYHRVTWNKDSKTLTVTFDRMTNEIAFEYIGSSSFQSNYYVM